jgi:hypothetical protein
MLSFASQQQQPSSMPTPTPYHYGTTAEPSATAEAKVPETPQDDGGEEQEQFNTQLNKMAVDLTNMIGVLPQKSPVKDPLHRFSGKQKKPRHLVWATQQQQVTTTMTTLSREASDG